ncbi:ribosome maturation factor RimP [candidate division KSB1 bacterium]|nr:ribosome maturation factor RimP [candidate division KSB1 bacterium]
MDNSVKIEQIRTLIGPLLEDEEVELIDIELKGNVGNQVLRIFVDVEGGINLSRCESLSREISSILDMDDVMSGKYRLEVSSPGIDRPLKTINDFRRNTGKRIGLQLQDGRSFEGTIDVVDDVKISMVIDSGDHVKFPIDQVVSGKIILPF